MVISEYIDTSIGCYLVFKFTSTILHHKFGLENMSVSRLKSMFSRPVELIYTVGVYTEILPCHIVMVEPQPNYISYI